MKIALITAADGKPGLGVAAGNETVIDVTAAASAAREAEATTRRLPATRTLKDLIAAGDTEFQALRDLVAWAEEMPREQAKGAGVLRAESAVGFLPPVPNPEKFLCVGKNYRAHLDELVRNDLIREIPEEPTGFIKLNAVIAAHGDAVARPAGIVQMDYEPELAFIIGRGGRRVSKENALNHVFGITLFNDLTAREIQRREVKSGTRFWTAKNMPGFGPIGPYVITLDEAGDFNNLDIECRVNGAHRMSVNTSGQIFRIDDIIEHFSRYMPMAPGDIFATGSAAGTAFGQDNADELFLRPGDEVEVALDGVMTLRNTIVEDDAPESS